MWSLPTAKDIATSARLARVKQRDTAPEMLVRRELHRLGRRFRVHPKGFPGRPDVVNRKHRWAIIVHGCFWHHHTGCRRATVPKNNRKFWLAKFSANRERDGRMIAALEADGYRTMVVWECVVSQPGELQRRLMEFFVRIDATF